jgi:hypothetical protein
MGANYQLNFGLSGENGPGGITTLVVTIGSQTTDFTITSDSSGFFDKPFALTTINYVATSANTAISFIEIASNDGGNNDAPIDGTLGNQCHPRALNLGDDDLGLRRHRRDDVSPS